VNPWFRAGRQAAQEGDSIMERSQNSPAETARSALRQLTASDWAQFGVQEIAYVRPVLVNGVMAVAIHAADGTQIGAAPDVPMAVAAILQHEMAPALVH
jgi:hypothetical protein